MENRDPNETMAMGTMKDEDVFKQTARRILTLSWFLLLIGTLLTLITNIVAYFGFSISSYWFQWPISYLFGSLTNIINFIIIILTLSRPKSIPKTSLLSGNYLLRMALYALACYIGYKVAFLHVIPVIIGFFTVRIAIFIYSYRNQG